MKMIIRFTVILLLLLPFTLPGQNRQVYNPEADAKADIKKAIELAEKNGKHVFLQIGGNWCPWCIKFHNFVESNAALKSYLSDKYEVVKVNYDRENRQEKLLEELEFPQRFGFPVFVVLDAKGNRIHTQNSAYLEKDKSYDQDVVLRFFENWSPDAVNPDSYKK